MTETERIAGRLMRGIRRELERLLAVDLYGLGRHNWQLRAAVTDAQAGIVAADFPALLGRELDGTAPVPDKVGSSDRPLPTAMGPNWTPTAEEAIVRQQIHDAYADYPKQSNPDYPYDYVLQVHHRSELDLEPCVDQGRWFLRCHSEGHGHGQNHRPRR